MALTERKDIYMTILPDAQVQVLTKTVFSRDRVDCATENHRHVVHPGQDLDGQDAKVRTVCEVLHTQGVVTAYEEARARADSDV